MDASWPVSVSIYGSASLCCVRPGCPACDQASVFLDPGRMEASNRPEMR